MEENLQPQNNTPKNSAAMTIGIIVIILIIAGAAYALTHKNSGQQSTQDYGAQTNPQPTGDTTNSGQMQMGDNSGESGQMASTTPSVTPSASPTPSQSGAANVKSFTVTGQNFSFSPSEIKVNKGDAVKITFQNNDGFHNFALDAFSVKTPTIPSGQTATVEFTANKTGTFEYYCSVANHRAMGMKGNLIVQ